MKLEVIKGCKYAIFGVADFEKPSTSFILLPPHRDN